MKKEMGYEISDKVIMQNWINNVGETDNHTLETT